MFQVSRLNSFHGKVQKLRNINLTVNPGEIVAVIGANGSGKSTLMGAIAGLYRPIQGDITLYGKSIAHLPADRIIREGLSLVPEGRQIFYNLTVRENLILGMYHQYGRNKKRVKEKIDLMMELFPGLQKHLNNYGGNLSGGEQQMLAIARGLMGEPKILLLDEPSIGLAPMVVAEILKTLQQIKDEMGTMVLLVEQNVRAALKVANRVYIMDRGEITMEGAARDLMENPIVQSTYLGYGESASTG